MRYLCCILARIALQGISDVLRSIANIDQLLARYQLNKKSPGLATGAFKWNHTPSPFKWNEQRMPRTRHSQV